VNHEGLELDDLDLVIEFFVCSKLFGGCGFFVERDYNGVKLVLDIVAAFFDEMFGGRGGDVQDLSVDLEVTESVVLDIRLI
jgi:hypothetical protein